MLMLTNLSGFGAVVSGAGPATVTYTDHAEDASDLTTYTFSNRAIGTAAGDRYVIVGLGCGAAAIRTASSVTVGGISATSCVVQSGGSFQRSEIWIAAVPTGTTATVVVTWSGGAARSAIALWAAYGITSATPTATQTSTSSTASVNLNVSAGGIAVGFAETFTSAASRTFTWTGLTKGDDVFLDGNDSITNGSGAFASAQTPLAITVTPSASITDAAYVFASFR